MNNKLTIQSPSVCNLFINAPNTDALTQTPHVPTCPAPPRPRRSYKASFILKL